MDNFMEKGALDVTRLIRRVLLYECLVFSV